MRPSKDEWNWARDKRKEPVRPEDMDTATYCKMFCAWKGGSPCLAADCPRRITEPQPTVTGAP